jgi:hypothetical protein
MSARKEALEDLSRVFGRPVVEVHTAVASVTPSSVSHAQARDVAKRCVLDGVLRDLGAIAARVVADELEASGLRAADYAQFDDVATIMQERIVKELQANPRKFSMALAEFLQMRG